MTPIEKLIEGLKYLASQPDRYAFVWNTDILELIKEFEASQPAFTPPWPVAVPEWAEWLICTDMFGNCLWSSSEDVCYGGRHEYAGKFEIPLGDDGKRIDWRKMKVRVK